MCTRPIKDNGVLNNNTYAIGPSIGVEIKVFNGLSLNSQSAPLYGFRDYDTFQSRDGWVTHFPILFSLGLKYTLTTK
jgi:nucleoside-specific outer membrane channel protein Tsx